MGGWWLCGGRPSERSRSTREGKGRPRSQRCRAEVVRGRSLLGKAKVVREVAGKRSSEVTSLVEDFGASSVKKWVFLQQYSLDTAGTPSFATHGVQRLCGMLRYPQPEWSAFWHWSQTRSVKTAPPHKGSMHIGNASRTTEI